jgi:hypothetical protein
VLWPIESCVSIGSLAGVTVFMQGVASLHSRFSLLRLIRDAEHFIETGRPIRGSSGPRESSRACWPVARGRGLENGHARSNVDRPASKTVRSTVAGEGPRPRQNRDPASGLRASSGQLAHLPVMAPPLNDQPPDSGLVLVRLRDRMGFALARVGR